jgi:hypothetical protein
MMSMLVCHSGRRASGQGCHGLPVGQPGEHWAPALGVAVTTRMPGTAGLMVSVDAHRTILYKFDLFYQE